MIDVDILGQLIPNPITMAVQLCSTLVLFLVMKKFLWPSVQNFLSKRAEKMQSELDASVALKQEADLDRTKASEQLIAAGKKSEMIVEAAVKEAKSEKEQILAQASKEAEDKLLKAQERIEKERLEMYQSMQKEMVDIALSATEKLIQEKSSSEMDKEAVDAFVKEAVHND